MLFIVGFVLVNLCTFGGFVLMGGHLEVIARSAPFEFIIIGGVAFAATLIANRGVTLKRLIKSLGMLVAKSKYDKGAYVELLCMMYQVFKLAKTKGLLALESHVENPYDSAIFQQFPRFLSDHHAVDFFCDYLRLVTLGADKPYELEALMDEEMEVHHTEDHEISHSVQLIADGLPAVGIVAAVLGVIKTMGAITEPPEVLGRLIGGALVGTFLGVWMAYGFFGPIANILQMKFDENGKYFQCMKIGLLGHLNGYAPSISIEYARKALLNEVRPTFTEVEEATGQLPAPG
ncbi:MAG: flagellar motor stator protein MotA [Alphaproteobacteria bacterium]|nr:flagellar motor stator protein MotA [Alphaproteobacteria bacterium]